MLTMLTMLLIPGFNTPGSPIPGVSVDVFTTVGIVLFIIGVAIIIFRTKSWKLGALLLVAGFVLWSIYSGALERGYNFTDVLN